MSTGYQINDKAGSYFLTFQVVYSGQTEPPIPVETEPLCFVI